MIAYLDYFIDRVTMYRLVLYYLIAIIVVALGLSFFKFLPYSPLSILESTAVLLAVCATINALFSWAFNAPTNLESTYITALILVCIIQPLQTVNDLPLILWAGILSIASKYIVAIRSKHLFNPAAIAVVLTAFWLGKSASWWVGTADMMPVILIGGIIMVHKLRRYNFMLTFFAVALITIAVFTYFRSGITIHNPNVLLDAINANISESIQHSPLLFFGFVMLTEPLTTPPTQSLQILYGALVGFLLAPQVHLGSIYSTPELALVVGNVFSYLVSPKIKERLTLQNQTLLSSDIVEFDFAPMKPLTFMPGQYMEFTLPHPKADSRGNRRYFTLASSPTEQNVRLGIKFYENSSTFKTFMRTILPGQSLMAGQLAGDFTLPKNTQDKLAFIAGGIGITPFRSMLKYLIDTNQNRSVTVLFMNKRADEIVYQDVFNEAALHLGIKTVHTLTESAPEGWLGRTGRINEQMIQEEIPDYKDRTFYISGPHVMVAAVESTLQKLGVQQARIKKDFFPGLA